MMKTLKAYFVNQFNSNRGGLLLFCGLSMATLIFLVAPHGAVRGLIWENQLISAGPVKISGKLSQNMLVRNGPNSVYLDVSIQTPSLNRKAVSNRATDMIIVLDRSGSMSGTKKMAYAKAAIRNVLSHLNTNDRFALISFASHAVVHTPLVAVTSGKREDLGRIIDAIKTGGGTNMSDGLNSALGLLESDNSERIRKVLLLSDGQANQGISHPEGLVRIASQLTREEAVLSSIGMGLDFNETLMTRLADHGMGQYAYLEDLSGLGRILTEDLGSSRNIYASASTLDINLGDGVTIADAGGYPVTRIDPSTVRISTGQLLADTNKNFVITFHVPNESIGTLSLAQMNLNYIAQGQTFIATLQEKNLLLSVVEAERREEVVSSIDSDVYRQSWLKNNLGRMQKKLSKWIREGKKDKAEQAIYEYREAVNRAQAESNMPLASVEMDEKLNEMEVRLDDSFSGSRVDQEIKRKRAAKRIQMDAIKEQRTTQ